jgi:hypothetical protein
MKKMTKDFTFKRPFFYCLKVTDIETNRDDRISQLFGEKFEIWYLGPNNSKVQEIYHARFWKDKKSAENAGIVVKRKSPDVIYEVLEFDREEFIKLIPDTNQNNNYVIIRNIKLKRQEIHYSKREKEFLSKYKCIDSYKEPEHWNEWLKCPNCDLRPLVWTFNNGSSTACGCGKNEYDHFSIHSESIMSYVKRNNGSALGYPRYGLRDNWNQWVETGEISFDIKKEVPLGKW